jgi:hypothetical protein
VLLASVHQNCHKNAYQSSQHYEQKKSSYYIRPSAGKGTQTVIGAWHEDEIANEGSLNAIKFHEIEDEHEQTGDVSIRNRMRETSTLHPMRLCLIGFGVIA